MSHAPAAHAPSHPHVPALKMGVPIPNGKLGMWLFLGTEIMFFTALIGTYIVLRLGSKGWPNDPEITHIRIWAGGLNTFVLITSSVFVVLAHEAMHLKKYKLATNWIIATTALAFVFLGIKSYEYYGKWDHDILPGHVAESPQQAIDKLARELDDATGLAGLQKEQTGLENQIIVADSQPGNEERSKGLKKQRDDLQDRLDKVGVTLSAYRDRPQVPEGEPAQPSFREKLKSGKISPHAAEEGLRQLREVKLPSQIAFRVALLAAADKDIKQRDDAGGAKAGAKGLSRESFDKRLVEAEEDFSKVKAEEIACQEEVAKEKADAAKREEAAKRLDAAANKLKAAADALDQVVGMARTEDLKTVRAAKADELALLRKAVRAFAAVHEPHYIKWGNTFASVYFLMTGFHALHVIIGVFMFAIVIWLGLIQQLGPQHAIVVENFGLYWHFVDLVWIFLFPLIYIA
jgi:heme/copper-type cytochrome/quinol oxidase subunit 3